MLQQNPGSFIPGEDTQDAGTLRRLQRIHEILSAVDQLDQGDQPEPMQRGPLPGDLPPVPIDPKTGKPDNVRSFFRKWGPLMQMGGSILTDELSRRGPHPTYPGTTQGLTNQWAGTAAMRQGEIQRRAEEDKKTQETFHRERMLNRRSILPTILSALLKDEKPPKSDREPTAQALLEFTEQQDWFQKKTPAEQDKIRQGILKVKSDEEDMTPYQRGYDTTRGRLDAEMESGGRWKPDKATAEAGDAFEREMYQRLLSKTQGPLEDPMTPEKAKMLAQQARQTYFGPKAQVPLPGTDPLGGGAAVPGGPAGFVPPELGDLGAQYPDIWKLQGALGGLNLPPFEMKMLNYTPGQQAAPSPSMPLPMAGGPGQPGTVPPQAMSPENLRPMRALLDWDKLVQKLQADPNGPAKLQAYRQAFLQQHGFDPMGQ